MTISRAEFDVPDVNTEAIQVEPQRLADNIVVESSVVRGGRQTLDGVRWRNVAFVGTRIRYMGGGVELSNVRFINCTFDLPEIRHAAQVAEYAALLPSWPLIIYG